MIKTRKKTMYIAFLLLATLARPLQAAKEAKNSQTSKGNKPTAPKIWFELAKQGKTSLLKDLFFYSEIDVNAKDESGNTALHWSVEKGHFDCLEYLVEQGADVNAKDKNDNTALILCAKYGEKESCYSHPYANCVEYLLQHGAHIYAKNKKGNTAFHYSASNTSIRITGLLEAQMLKCIAQLQSSIKSAEEDGYNAEGQK